MAQADGRKGIHLILRDAAKRPLLRMRVHNRCYTTTLKRFAARVMPV